VKPPPVDRPGPRPSVIRPTRLETRDAYEAALRAWVEQPGLDMLRWLDNQTAKCWNALYRKGIDHEASIDAVSYRAGEYLYDWAFSVEGHTSGRVVAAYGRSRRFVDVPTALEEWLRAVTEATGVPAAADQCWDAVMEEFDASADRTRARVRPAALKALDLGERSAAWLVGLVVERHRRAMAVPGVMSVLGDVDTVLRSALGEPGSPAAWEPVGGSRVDGAALDSLGRLALRVDTSVPHAIRIATLQRLARHLPKSPERVLFDEMRDCASVGRAAFVVGELGPAFARRRGRPRRSWAQQHFQRMEHADAVAYPVDVGHFLAHSSGGPSNINFFVQDRRLNRGWSLEGRRYRRMEQYVAGHPGTVYFSRPVYDEPSNVPRWIEYGMLLDAAAAREIPLSWGLDLLRVAGIDGPAFWIELFENRPTA
jgi:hypothetical protein